MSSAMQLGQKLAKPKTLPEEREAMDNLADEHGSGMNEGNLLTLKTALTFADGDEKDILKELAAEETRNMIVGGRGIRRDPRLRAHFGPGIGGAIAYGQFVSRLATEEEVNQMAKKDVEAMLKGRKDSGKSMVKEKKGESA